MMETIMLLMKLRRMRRNNDDNVYMKCHFNTRTKMMLRWQETCGLEEEQEEQEQCEEGVGLWRVAFCMKSK